MAPHQEAGKLVNNNDLIDIDALVSAYYERKPDISNMNQRVSFGTSGHRGSSLKNNFTETHIMAITQAICDYRASNQIYGPLYIGKDTHALSTPAEKTAIQVFAANNVSIIIAEKNGFTPTPVISHAILIHNKNKNNVPADGVVITPSHNPPEDGGLKYNGLDGGPANTKTTEWIANRANVLIENKNKEVKILDYTDAIEKNTTSFYNFIKPYVEDLINVIDMDAIKNANLKICADALGGSAMQYWEAIRDTYELDIDIKNKEYDPAFSFMHKDHDGKIRMDCSSIYAMSGLIKLKDEYDVAFGNDPDADRHGIITPSLGLLNPNHFLAVAIHYLFNNRKEWDSQISIGKTLVSSSIIDRIANNLGRKIKEVPVGFKWFVEDLLYGVIGFAGEESAGASFLRKDGSVWSTDKDGIILSLLACEIHAVLGKDPGQYYKDLTLKHGDPMYARVDAIANSQQKEKLSQLSPTDVTENTLAGEIITQKITHASSNQQPIHGLKVCTENGWFAARPSGTEDIYKIYTESFHDQSHLEKIQIEAAQIVSKAVNQTG